MGHAPHHGEAAMTGGAMVRGQFPGLGPGLVKHNKIAHCLLQIINKACLRKDEQILLIYRLSIRWIYDVKTKCKVDKNFSALRETSHNYETTVAVVV